MVRPNQYSLGLKWGSVHRYGTGTEKKRGYNYFGCASTSLSNLTNREFGFKPKQTDALLRSWGAYLDNDRVIFDKVGVAWTSLGGATGWATSYFGRDDDALKIAARQRKYKILIVSLHPDNPNKQHYVALAGIGSPVDSTVNSILITDPQDDNRRNLGDAPYRGAWQGLVSLDKTALPPDTNPSVYIATSSTDIKFHEVFSGQKKIALIKAGSKAKEKSSEGIVSLLEVGSDGEDNGDTSLGGYLLSIPQASEGQYSVNITSLADVNGSIEIRAFNSENQISIERTIPVQIKAGEIQTLSFPVSNHHISNGTLMVTEARIAKSPASQNEMSMIRGTLNFDDGSNGINSQSDEVDIRIGDRSYVLFAGGLHEAAGYLRYVNSFSKKGVVSFTIDTDKNFELLISGLDLASSLISGGLPISFQIGDDSFEGSISPTSIKAADSVTIKLNEATVAAGERASGGILADSELLNHELEFYLLLIIDGQRIFSQRTSNYSWSFVTNRLGSGVHTLEAKLFWQNRRTAEETEVATRKFRSRISEIDGCLGQESDPEIIDKLENERSTLLQKIDQMEYNLGKTRTQIKGPVHAKILVR